MGFTIHEKKTRYLQMQEVKFNYM